MKVRIEGQLIEQAQCRVHTDGTASVQVVLGGKGGLPVVADRSFGTGAAALYAASTAARAMRIGTPVVAHGLGMRQGRRQGARVLFIEGVEHIDYPIPEHYSERTAAHAA